MAFTTAAFSSTSNMGSETSETRMRCSTGSACHAVTHSCSTSRPSGSSLTSSTSGPTRARWAPPVAGSVATFSANAIMTPYMSLSRSQRETCTTSGVAGSSGPPSRTILAWRVTVPVEPPFGKIAGPVSFGGVTRPTALRIDTTVRWSKWMFLTANGSMAGGSTRVRPADRDWAMYSAREKTSASALTTYGERKAQASWLRVVQDHDVAGGHQLVQTLPVGPDHRLVPPALGITQRTAVPG